jgi:hypothetical protein
MFIMDKVYFVKSYLAKQALKNTYTLDNRLQVYPYPSGCF